MPADRSLAHIVIAEVEPTTPSGRFPPKGATGQRTVVRAVLLKDGHDELGAALRWRPEGGEWRVVAMTATGADARWTGSFTPQDVGAHRFQVLAWTDRFATWRRDLAKRAAARQDLRVEFEVGAQLLDHLATRASAGHFVESASGAGVTPSPTQVATRLEDGAAALRRTSCSDAVRLAAAADPSLAEAASRVVPGWDLTRDDKRSLWVDRLRGAFSAWYELFPRSYGGFRGVVDELPRIASMGFDVLYLPPIHPIGRTHRKGRNNTLVPGPNDPGSPWAIGAAEGGHTAIAPELGTEDDFAALVAAATAHGIDIALDYALQCSPDHPWVAAHPEWFNQLPDGSIRYAENPPKKYQDIYPINFWPDREKDRVALWSACKGVLEHWIERGVRIFRVDNPHTKPFAFWQWVIAEIHRRHPDVLFLAEAFTDPGRMHRLAELGFSQSYTYFTWRHSRAELQHYVEELSRPPLSTFFRPNFWPNTPDILEGVLRDGPLAAFALRAVLAATLVPNYGVYSGFELGENTPASPDNTEYLDSEKYQLVTRDYDREPNLRRLLTRLNTARRNHSALQKLTGTHFHHADNPSILVYSRVDTDDGDVVLAVVNLDPHRAQDATLTLDLVALGFDWDQAMTAVDELTGETYLWKGPHPWVRLDPWVGQPAHLLHLRRR